MCEDVGIESIEPMWNEDTESLINEILDSGIESYIVYANASLIDKRWVGKKIDKKFIEYAKNKGIDPCGEYGEFHTFVTGGPLMDGKIRFKKYDVIKKDNAWVLKVKKYEVIQ